MLNVLKKVGEMARCISEGLIDHSGREKNSHILKHQIQKNTLVHNMRISKLLVVVSAVTVRRENYIRIKTIFITIQVNQFSLMVQEILLLDYYLFQ